MHLPIYSFLDKPQCKEIGINHTYNQINNEVNVTCNLDAYPEDVTFYWTHRNSSSNSSWSTRQVPHTRLELQETDSEIYCWGINDIGVQTSPCRFLLIKGKIFIHFSGNTRFFCCYKNTKIRKNMCGIFIRNSTKTLTFHLPSLENKKENHTSSIDNEILSNTFKTSQFNNVKDDI